MPRRSARNSSIASERRYTPSFFTAHVYYWGDRHRDLFLGPERAARMDPMRSALDRGLVITAHCDSPIVPADPLLSIWVSVNRLTSSGQVLGPDQRISVLEALRAHTFNPAWQNFQENAKGSIEPASWPTLWSSTPIRWKSIPPLCAT